MYAHAGEAAHRKVVIGYGPRWDPIVRHLSGVKIAIRSRITSIEAHAPNPSVMQKVWSYKLTYETGADTNRSRLISVTQADQFGEESWTRRFEWTNANAPMIDHTSIGEPEFDDVSWSLDLESWKKSTAFWVDEYGGHHDYFEGVDWVDRTDVRLMVGDFDGDGIDDVLYRTHPTRLRDYISLEADSPGWDYVKGDYYERGRIRMRRSLDQGALPLSQVSDVTEYLEPSALFLEDPPIWGPERWQAHLGKSRLADLNGDGKLDLFLARTEMDHQYSPLRVSPNEEEYPGSDEEYWAEAWFGADGSNHWGHWSFGYANVGAFQPSTQTWDPAQQSVVGAISIFGPIWSESADASSSVFRMFTPPFQHIIADLDGDGRPDGVDAFYYDPAVDMSDPVYNWPLPIKDGNAQYKTELSTDPWDEHEFPPIDTASDLARWTCGNGRAIVLDYEGDGRADVLAATDTDFDPHHMADGIYARLHVDGTTPRTGQSSHLWGGACHTFLPEVLMGDWNGDGLEDLLYPPLSYWEDSPPIENAEPLVRWNLGNGFGPAEKFSVDNAAMGERMFSGQPYPGDPYPGSRPVGWDRGTRAVDLNRDGRTDILAMRFTDPDFIQNDGLEGPKTVFAYLSTGDGFTAIKLADWENANISMAEGFTTFQVGDVTGDGALDIVHVEKGKIVTTELPWRDPPDMLKWVKDDGAAAFVEGFSYDSAWWGGGKRPEPADCDYPLSCSRRAFPVVRAHVVFAGTMPSGEARYRQTQHSYADPRSDLRGRGFLGFAEHRIWDSDLGAETVQSFDNTTRIDPEPAAPGGEFYPYAMVEVGTKTTTPDMALPTDLELSSGTSNFPGQSGDSVTVMTRTVEMQRDFELRFSDDGRSMTRLPSGWAKTELDVLALAEDVYQEVPRYTFWWTTSAADERFSTGSTTHDACGNATYAMTVTVGGVVSTVTRAFENRIDVGSDWLLGLEVRAEARSGASADVDPGRITRKSYDAETGRLTSLSVNAQGPSDQPCVMIGSECELLSSTTTFSLPDAHGNPRHIETVAFDDPNTRLLTVQYDADGVYPVQTVDALGFVTTTLTHPALGVPLLEVDVNGVTTTATFDGFGRVLSVARPGAATVSPAYAEVVSGNHIGLKVTTTAPNGSATNTVSEVTTDELGRTVKSRATGFAGAWIYTDVEYDHFGNVSRQSIPATALPAPYLAWSAFDRLGRVLSTTSPDTTVTRHGYSMFETTTIDPDDHQTYTEHDIDGRVLESGHLVGGSEYGAVHFRYGSFGQMEEVEDALQNVTVRRYDPFGRLLELDDPDAGVSGYMYDGFGQLRQELRATGDLIERDYDDLGRLLTTTGEYGTDTLDYDDGVGAKHQLGDIIRQRRHRADL